MSKFRLHKLEFDLGTPAPREHIFSPQFTQLENVDEEQRKGFVEAVACTLCEARLPINSDVSLKLGTFGIHARSYMFRRMTRNERGIYTMDIVGRGISKAQYCGMLSQLGITDRNMVNAGYDWVQFVQMDPALLGRYLASSTSANLGEFVLEVNKYFPEAYRLMKHNAAALLKNDYNVSVFLSDAAGEPIPPNLLSGAPLAIASFSLICAITKALGRRNVIFDNIDLMYGNNALEMMSRVKELCLRQDLQIIGTSKPMGISSEVGAKVIQI